MQSRYQWIWKSSVASILAVMSFWAQAGDGEPQTIGRYDFRYQVSGSRAVSQVFDDGTRTYVTITLGNAGTPPTVVDRTDGPVMVPLIQEGQYWVVPQLTQRMSIVVGSERAEVAYSGEKVRGKIRVSGMASGSAVGDVVRPLSKGGDIQIGRLRSDGEPRQPLVEAAPVGAKASASSVTHPVAVAPASGMAFRPASGLLVSGQPAGSSQAAGVGPGSAVAKAPAAKEPVLVAVPVQAVEPTKTEGQKAEPQAPEVKVVEPAKDPGPAPVVVSSWSVEPSSIREIADKIARKWGYELVWVGNAPWRTEHSFSLPGESVKGDVTEFTQLINAEARLLTASIHGNKIIKFTVSE